MRKQQRPWIDLQPAISGVIADLVSANVIGDKSKLAYFNLTNTELTVNGKKQPEKIHEKLKVRYLHETNYGPISNVANDPNFGLHYDANNGSMGLGISIEKSGP
jgi:bla regulator protein BlaR1